MMVEWHCVVDSATQLTCSIGVAANKRLAKIVTDINKPNGYFILPSDAMVIKQFVSQLPCRKIPGIGKVTFQLSFDIETCP